MSEKTVKNAVTMLPEKCRGPFLRAWKSANCMDLYSGELEAYLQIIAQVMEDRQERLDSIKKAFATLLQEVKELGVC